MRRLIRVLAVLGLVAVVIAVIRRLMAGAGEPPPSTTPWEPLPPDEPAAPAPSPAAGVDTATPVTRTNGDRADAGRVPPAGQTTWVEPAADGSCPAPFPVKAKLSSEIFHVPGGASYERTGADRCYADAAAAEADGLRRAKR